MIMKTAYTMAASALLAARSENRPLAGFPTGSAPDDIGAALAIQDAQIALAGEPIGAWKVGPGSADFPPTSAPITVSRILASPARLSMALRLKAVEVEIAFRLGADLPACDAPYTTDAVRAAIVTVMPVIEAVETRYDSWPVADRLWALADNQSNEALIIGPETRFAPGDPPRTDAGTLTIGGRVKAADRGFPGGDPFALIAWLAGHLGGRDAVLAERGLKAGDIVTTGSWNGVDFSADGLTVQAAFPGLGAVTLGYA